MIYIQRADNRVNGSITYHRLASPIELAVVHESAFLVEALEQVPQVLVVRRLEEVQSADVSQVRRHLFRVAVAQHLDRRVPLRLADLLVPFLQRVGLQPLPRQAAAQEVHEHVTQRLQVVSSALLWLPGTKFIVLDTAVTVVVGNKQFVIRCSRIVAIGLCELFLMVSLTLQLVFVEFDAWP